jgi:predicted PolB exonuclease-like 3'-5' exonuclease
MDGSDGCREHRPGDSVRPRAYPAAVAARVDREYLVLDIETVPDSTRWSAPERPHGVEPPFPPTWAHRVIAIGCLWLGSDYRLKRLGVASEGPDDERGLLAAFSSFVGAEQPLLVTFNGRSFDLPVIALRSLCHGVPLGWYYREGLRHRYSDDGHLDLCDWLADHGASRSSSLDALARLIGLPGKTGIDGSQVEGLYRAGDAAAIERYCLGDVAQTALLFLRFQLLRGLLPPAAYRTAATELLADLRADARLAAVTGGIDDGQLLATAEDAPDAGAAW